MKSLWYNSNGFGFQALNFNPPEPKIAESFNLTYDEKYWGKESNVHAGWPSFQYPGLCELRL